MAQELPELESRAPLKQQPTNIHRAPFEPIVMNGNSIRGKPFDSGRPATKDFFQRVVRPLTGSAAIFALMSVAIAWAVGIYVYKLGTDEATKIVYEKNLTLAHAFEQYARNEGGNGSSDLSSVRAAWKQMDQPPGSYLCIIGADGMAKVHTAEPALVGTYMGDQRIDAHGSGPRTVNQLFETRQDWVGPSYGLNGQEEIGAFVYSDVLDALVGVYNPAHLINSEIRAAAMPEAAGIALVTTVLLPITFVFLHRAYKASRRELERTNVELRQEIHERLALEGKNRLLAAFPRENPNPVLACDKEGTVVYANEAAQQLLDQTELGESGRLFPTNEFSRPQNCLDEGKCRWGIETILGDRVYSWTYNPVPSIECIHIYGRDVTETKRAHERIEESLREKEILLQEVYHRVKNNLQIVSSLLKQQSAAVQNEEARGVFSEMQHRIHSMALVHQALYQSTDLGQIAFDGYIRNLAANLVRSSNQQDRRVALEFDLEEISLGLDYAIPCGLILNELITNAIKYAFPEGRRGTIRVELRKLTEGSFRMAVSDDGAGISGGIDLENPLTLGLRLVHDLTYQLGGEMKIDHINGTTFQLTFSESA